MFRNTVSADVIYGFKKLRCRGVVVPLVERGLRWWPDYPDKCYYPGDCRADNYLCHCKGEEVVSCKS